MNVDIRNVGEFRVTSHGGRAYDLFNRTSNEVHTITKVDYEYIVYGLKAECKDMIDRCVVIDRLYSSIMNQLTPEGNRV